MIKTVINSTENKAADEVTRDILLNQILSGPRFGPSDIIRKNHSWWIYVISIEGSNKIYVGSTTKWSNRARGHFCSLKKGDHPNRYLQNSYDKRKGSDGNIVWIYPVEEVAKEGGSNHLLERERFWIKSLRAHEKIFGFNLRPDPTQSGTFGKIEASEVIEIKRRRMLAYWRNPKKACRLFVLYDPNGERVEISNLSQFCEKNGLPYDKMYSVAIGTGISCEGWKKDPDRKNESLVSFRIRSPDGIIYEGCNFAQFCIDHDLPEVTLRNVIRGSTKIWRGWTLPDKPPEFYRSRSKTYTLQHNDGREITITNLEKWCREGSGKIWANVIMRGQKSGGWKIKS
jgi:hypothetical protein